MYMALAHRGPTRSHSHSHTCSLSRRPPSPSSSAALARTVIRGTWVGVVSGSRFVVTGNVFGVPTGPSNRTATCRDGQPRRIRSAGRWMGHLAIHLRAATTCKCTVRVVSTRLSSLDVPVCIHTPTLQSSTVYVLPTPCKVQPHTFTVAGW